MNGGTRAVPARAPAGPRAGRRPGRPATLQVAGPGFHGSGTRVPRCRGTRALRRPW